MRLASLLALALALALATSCVRQEPRVAPPQPAPAGSSPAVPASDDEPPPAPREFRAAWVATVANIDWPSRRGLAVDQQRAEMIAILERARALNLNALILQVRPSADAIYPSQLEPWSEYLTGEQGRAPEPYYDPLATWIAEAHRRGIEIHAWFNPYRARHTRAQSREAPSHVSRTRPALVKQYGEFLWLDPGEPEAARHTLEVILDVVRRYDIDGVHIDDYFYPYPVTVPRGNEKEELDFPDDASWRAYLASGGTLGRADWRRGNVNRLIERINAEVHREKPWVRFGISPFGIGHPDRRPPGIAGFSQFDRLYADVELWMRRCWLDYVAPQLYWPIAQPAQAFPVLLDYWIAENTCGRRMYPGLFTSRIDPASAQSWQPDEIVNQVAEIRRRGGASGHIHFSMVALAQNRSGIVDALASRAYATAALIPTSPWLGAEPPAEPAIALRGATGGAAGVQLEITPRGAKPVARWAVWTRAGGEWRFTALPGMVRTVDLGAAAGPIDRVVVSAVDRLGNESPRAAATPPFSMAAFEAAIVRAADWGAIPADASRGRRQAITRITLHHQGVAYPAGRDPREYLRSLQKWSREAKGWVDIPYHYVVDLRGRVYEARDIGLAGDTNTEYDPAGHALIQVVGNFDEVEPNAAQLRGIAGLMAWLAAKHGLDERSIASHRDLSAMTSCPGTHLYRYIENGWFRDRVREHLAQARR